jgi:hypothetical protein
MRFVNEMLIEVASWMNLARIPSVDTSDPYAFNDRIGMEEKEAIELEETLDKELTGEFDAIESGEGDSGYSLPSAGYQGLYKTISVLNILPGWRVTNVGSDNPVKKTSVFSSIKDGFVETSNLTAAHFIPFGLTAGVQVSESFQNQTMEHPLASELKDKGKQVYQQSALGFLGKTESIIGAIDKFFSKDYIGGAFDVGKDLIKSAAGKGKFGEAGMIMSGEGKFVLPNIWEDSNFQRTQNLSFKFFSPYGYRLSVFENTMIQTIFLICMTAPRQVGTSTYTSPFYVRAYSKGLFSIELGLITSLSISRSEDKNQRTVEGFSKSVSCQVELKDVLPSLMVGLDAGVFGILSAKNVGFREYIAMMANVDLYDRTIIINRYKTFISALTNKFDPENLMNDFKYGLSQTLPFKLIHRARVSFWQYRPPQTVSSVRSQSSYSF